jgi:hypothetical protein
MTEVKEFSKRLDKIFEDGEPTKALIIDAYIKTNPNALKQGQSLPLDSVMQSNGCVTEAERLYRNNKRFAGVTMYAEVTGTTLKEAKIYCDNNFV